MIYYFGKNGTARPYLSGASCDTERTGCEAWIWSHNWSWVSYWSWMLRDWTGPGSVTGLGCCVTGQDLGQYWSWTCDCGDQTILGPGSTLGVMPSQERPTDLSILRVMCGVGGWVACVSVDRWDKNAHCWGWAGDAAYRMGPPPPSYRNPPPSHREVVARDD